jgi:hypothetical protein
MTLSPPQSSDSLQQFFRVGRERAVERQKAEEGNQSVYNYFKPWRVPSEDKISPVNLIMIGGGKWMVPKERMRQFYNTVLEKWARKNMLFSLVEKPHPIGKLVYDFDSEDLVLNRMMIASVIAECVHLVFGDPDDEYWPTVYSSVSSGRPQHKMHFIVPSCVCTINHRRCMYLLTRRTFIERGHADVSDCLDLKMTSLRMRYAYKVDPKTRQFVPEKGRYERFELAYPDPAVEVVERESTKQVPLFYFSALSFDEPCTKITEKGLELLEKVRVDAEMGPLRHHKIKLTSVYDNGSDTHDSIIHLSREQQQEVIERLHASEIIAPLLEECYQLDTIWGVQGHILKLLRRKSGACPLDDSGQRIHDNQNAYIFTNDNGSKCWLSCYCGCFASRILWGQEISGTEEDSDSESDSSSKDEEEDDDSVNRYERTADGSWKPKSRVIQSESKSKTTSKSELGKARIRIRPKCLSAERVRQEKVAVRGSFNQLTRREKEKLWEETQNKWVHDVNALKNESEESDDDNSDLDE